MPANAQPGPTVTTGTIDATKTGSLTIYKQDDTKVPGVEATGEKDDANNANPLAGAKFQLYRVYRKDAGAPNGYRPLDLTTNNGLAEAAGLNKADFANKPANTDITINGSTYQLRAEGSELTTGTQGEATWPNLALGVYLLRETSAPTKEVNGKTVQYTKAVDSLVFVPMTRNNKSDGGTEWLYDITAYPKNGKQQKPEKTVQDSGKNVGDTVTYTIDTYAQTLGEGQKRTIYRIEDQLDPKLSATTDNIKVFKNGTELDADAYTKSVDQNGKVVVYLNNPADLANGDKITVEIAAKVTEKPGNGDLKNQATHFQNNPNDTQDYKPGDTPNDTPGEPTNEVHTFYGDLEFTKVNSGGQSLADAEFKVFGIKGDQTCDTLDWKNPGNNAKEQKTANQTDGVWKSGANGKVTITGLHANNIANYNMARDENGNVTVRETKNEWTSYCLVETKSPKGYELLAKPIKFEINANKETGANGEDVWTVANGSVKVGNTDNQVVNLEDSTPKLPLTGGMGIGILAALGALIIAAGAYSAKRRSA